MVCSGVVFDKTYVYRTVCSGERIWQKVEQITSFEEGGEELFNLENMPNGFFRLSEEQILSFVIFSYEFETL